MRDHPSVFGQITSESKEITNLIFKQDSTDVRCEVASIRGYRKVEVANFTTGTLEMLSEAYKVENYYAIPLLVIFLIVASLPTIFAISMKKDLEAFKMPTPRLNRNLSLIEEERLKCDLKENNICN
jgi:hypothetical protein